MRYVIEVYREQDHVCGSVASESCASPRPFHGWLELLSLLEPALADAAGPEVDPRPEPSRPEPPGADRTPP
ncbi:MULTISPECIES: hypothetical protein [Streptomyces]|uniref:Uncharacterized protein n=2 Tax=Streptomyces TaxID=1883 RepID=A0A0W7X5D5_9ACTN|nr:MULTISPECIES: hypothetical protein [Streptomyces]KUF17946.1 hypothetical protein AT728_19990 [Streptomyces silvensis]MVO85685.1 hypothetical protein [Streptomyces typhae]